MATVIVGGDVASFNSYVYGADRDPNTLQFIRNSVNFIPNYSNTLTQAGNSYLANAYALSESLVGNRALELARMSLNRVNNAFVRNDIHYISDIDRLQNAPLIMQRYVMAMPEIRQMYQEQRCDGYSDTYRDMHPGDIGETHYDYRRVMNGMVVDEDGTDKVSFYLDDIIEGDRELLHSEQSDILKTWEVVADLIKFGKDPTDSFGGG